ncbi:hypothetical protein BX600DRAFT_442500 [Xylariales sp. PMI_506]|nr:hypothetical protein BX600DRAFT_442500 [Xylariales sp. PMI_506]
MGIYPGLGLPLRHVSPRGVESYPIGAHGSCRGALSDMLPVRELAMMSVTDRLTDKEEWHKKVFDDAIVSRWREEALQISDEYFLKLATSDKPQRWVNEGKLIVRDDHASAYKPLRGVMSAATFDYCIKELRNKARYYEKSGIIPTLDACASVVKADNLVCAELEKALRTAFDILKQEQSSAPDWHPNSNDMVHDLVHPSMYPLIYGRSKVLHDEVVGVGDAINNWAGKGEVIPQDYWTYDNRRDRFRYGVGSGEVPPNYWSDNYIKNLHPIKFPEIYRTIEKLIETALPLWDQCLGICTGYSGREGAGRDESRFLYPDNPGDENKENWDPSDAQELANVEVNWEEVTGRHKFSSQYQDEINEKWKLLRDPVIPEHDFEDVEYQVELVKRLVQKFRDSGLQIIVKLVSIELTPEKPEFPVGEKDKVTNDLQVEGQMNEHICGTALYYFDSENVSPSNLSFRMQTSAYMNDEINVGQDAYNWLELIYGTTLGGRNSPCLQNYGSVETREGRMLAFPNVLVSSFRLQDPTKSGHRRFIALWLKDWYPESVLGNTQATIPNPPTERVTSTSGKGLGPTDPLASDETKVPSSIETGREPFDAGTHLMGVEEAKYHRLELMTARSAFVETAENGWHQHAYSFCEH